MFPSALTIAAPIPFALDLTMEFGPVLVLALLALLDLSAVAVLHAALVAQHGRDAVVDAGAASTLVPLRPEQSEKSQAAPPSRAA